MLHLTITIEAATPLRLVAATKLLAAAAVDFCRGKRGDMNLARSDHGWWVKCYDKSLEVGLERSLGGKLRIVK